MSNITPQTYCEMHYLKTPSEKYQDAKSIYKNQCFLYTNNEQTENEYRKTIPFTIA
jgi:hypothetical protein